MNRAGPAPGINRADNLRLNPESSHVAILIRLNVVRSLQAVELCPLGNGTLYLLRQGSHILLAAPVGNAHLLGTQADSGTGAVHGYVAAADHHNLLAGKVRHIVIANPLQKLNCGDDALGIFSFNANLLVGMGTDGNIDGIVLVVQRLEGNLPLALANPRIQVHLHAGAENCLQILVQSLPWEAVIRNAISQHAAQLLLFLKDHRMVPHQLKIISSRKPGRAATDNCHLFPGALALLRHRHRICMGMVNSHALQAADVD